METQKSALVEVLVTIPFNNEQIAAIREVSPRLKVTLLPVRKPEEINADQWLHTEILYTDRILPQPDLVPNLRWVQSHYAGMDSLQEFPLLKKPDLVVTTLSGAAAPQMAEYALSMILALGHRMGDLQQAQSKGEWPRDRWERFRPQELRGSTVGIVGYGSIGREIARLLHAFGASVLATRRNAMHPEDSGYAIPGLGDPGGDLFTRLYPPQALGSMLRECDFVVVCLPITPETRNIFGAAEFQDMKPSAYLIAMARGGVVDQTALFSALQERKIAGAALDVFMEEPLPPNHPFWRMNNVIVTPHIAGMSAHYDDRAVALFIENLKRYLGGQTPLNRYDPNKGY